MVRVLQHSSLRLATDLDDVRYTGVAPEAKILAYKIFDMGPVWFIL
jgi:hypothetical protein